MVRLIPVLVCSVRNHSQIGVKSIMANRVPGAARPRAHLVSRFRSSQPCPPRDCANFGFAALAVHSTASLGAFTWRIHLASACIFLRNAVGGMFHFFSRSISLPLLCQSAIVLAMN